MRRTVLRPATLLALAAGLTACSTTRPSTEEAFETYAHAVGTSDFEAMMSMYAEDARWTVDHLVRAEDRDGVRQSHDYERGLGSVRTISRWEVDGDTVRVYQSECSEFFRLFGVEEIESLSVYRFENGRIQRVETLHDPEGLSRMAPEVTRFFQWLETAHPDLCAQMFADGGRFTGTGAQGARMLELAREWTARQRG